MTIAENLMRRGKIEGKLEVAMELLNKGQTVEFISEVTGISKKDLLKLDKESTQH